jgi:cysteinyl-tRNA synthetase
MKKLSVISNFMESLSLDYVKRKIGGVSHLYGLFSFCASCVENGIAIAAVKEKIANFYDCWEAKEYGQQHIRQYKESMSARTKDQGQRKKRRKALEDFCLSS